MAGAAGKPARAARGRRAERRPATCGCSRPAGPASYQVLGRRRTGKRRDAGSSGQPAGARHRQRRAQVLRPEREPVPAGRLGHGRRAGRCRPGRQAAGRGHGDPAAPGDPLAGRAPRLPASLAEALQCPGGQRGPAPAAGDELLERPSRRRRQAEIELAPAPARTRSSWPAAGGSTEGGGDSACGDHRPLAPVSTITFTASCPGELDAAAVEALLTESSAPAPPGTTAFDSQLGFAVRRWCAPVLDLEPSAPAADYLSAGGRARRAEVGPPAADRGAVEAWLVDTGYQSDAVSTPEQLAEASGAPRYEVVRLESIAERWRARAATRPGSRPRSQPQCSQAAATRSGSSPSPPTGTDSTSTRPGRPRPRSRWRLADWLRALEARPAARLEDQVLHPARHLAGAGHGAAAAVPRRLRRHRLATAPGRSGAAARLPARQPARRHCRSCCCTATRTTARPAYLAHVFPHVYMDVGEALNHVGARSAAVLAEALELTPFHKMLYSSDAFGLPELHYLGATGFRRDLASGHRRVRRRRRLVGRGRRPGRAPDRGGQRAPGVPAGREP